MRRRRGAANKRQNVLFDVNPDVLSASKMRAAWRQLINLDTKPTVTFVVHPSMAAVAKQLASWTADPMTVYSKHVLKTVYQDSYSTVPCGVWEPSQPGASSGVCQTCGHCYPSHLEQIQQVHDEVTVAVDFEALEKKVIADLSDDTPFWGKDE